MDKGNIWLVIPVYNEAKYLAKVLKKVSQITKNYIIVDDGSSDESVSIAKKHAEHVLVHKINLGKGAAMKTGCDYAFEKLGAEAIIFIDSDDQHDPGEIELFFAEFKKGEQVVFGERAMDHSMPLIRIIGNRFASVFVLLLFGVYVPDIPSGFKALSKSAYKKIRWQDSGYGVELEIAARVAKNKLPYSVVPISTIYHDFDRGMTALDAIDICLKLINLKLTL